MPGIDACLDEAMALPGARGASVVDWTSGLSLGTAGESPGGDAEATAAETAELARAAAEYATFAPEAAVTEAATSEGAATEGAAYEGAASEADKGLPVEDVIVSTRTGYHVLCFVETTFDSSVFIHLWLDGATGNLALARIRMRQLAQRLVLG
ncbi:hypothetical protein [Streptomyces montanisoli]|uniref:Roadblock/LC7 domain-containing protein n=1 Tax=Streptomyces montanisoli TaxID=2798581 RepID=A0A940RX93_9ACTN|nr:hypothetical protein [Streptomyces montanisoli]MBP0457374.1 hypothetical protein [Streptomyces montanisoli]